MKIRVFFEYKCYPIWVYDSKGDMIGNALPQEIAIEKELDDEFMRLQQIYEQLFTDNSVEFKYNGFSNEKERLSYIEDINQAIEILKSKLGAQYKLDIKINI